MGVKTSQLSNDGPVPASTLVDIKRLITSLY